MSSERQLLAVDVGVLSTMLCGVGRGAGCMEGAAGVSRGEMDPIMDSTPCQLQRSKPFTANPGKRGAQLVKDTPKVRLSLAHRFSPVSCRSSAERKFLITRDLCSQPVIHSIAALA